MDTAFPNSNPMLDQTRPLARQVYDNLHARIISFDLVPHQRLSEKQIAEELRVSRTPVREALARLADHRLVDILPQRGTLVAPLRLTDLEQSQMLREAIELALLRRVMECPDRTELVTGMRAEIRLQKAFVEVDDVARFYDSDEQLHGMIARFVGMASILKEIERAKMHMDRVRRLMISGIDELSVVIAQHEGIVDAIEAGDLVKAQSLMLEHLRRIFSYLGEAVAKYPEYFEDARKWVPAARELRGS